MGVALRRAACGGATLALSTGAQTTNSLAVHRHHRHIGRLSRLGQPAAAELDLRQRSSSYASQPDPEKVIPHTPSEAPPGQNAREKDRNRTRLSRRDSRLTIIRTPRTVARRQAEAGPGGVETPEGREASWEPSEMLRGRRRPRGQTMVFSICSSCSTLCLSALSC